MKRMTSKSYLVIPVFLNLLAFTGQVSADELGEISSPSVTAVNQLSSVSGDDGAVETVSATETEAGLELETESVAEVSAVVSSSDEPPLILAPAQVEVVDYKEDKQDFTVQVVGSPQTKQVSQVRIAVWSDNKGQDDIKWYEPAIVNNQASTKVNIANHSNTSDNYHVHVYTTYADKTTIGSNLGTYKIVKKELPAAKVEVVDYKEDKQDFTVQVVGSPQTKQVSQVRIAVWSDNKGQDDIKWYEPAIVNNQASTKVNIANHSNTSDNYHVHVYTTYADKTTIGSNLGTYKIVKKELPAAQVEVVDYKEDKQDFTVQVVGSPQTKQVSQVRIAVWSDNKGQDDIKWYEPAIVNNQASTKVNIANHSNTSDNYHVHVYTTYADNTTIGSNLGTYKIVKKELPAAKVEVVDYKEDKQDFTVQVVGSPQTKQVSQVRIAVWSDNKGQDDIKWYEPAIVNNQARASVNIANHSNTSDNYHVHIYTTYADKTTIGSNLGTYKIVKKELPAAKVEVVDYKEDKQDFTVQVVGSPQTKQVSQVRIAVWSDNKGQDDIKWYEPAIVNNQASTKVNIANHSNTSDNYHVHVYTTYADKTTIGSNLGTYKIVKKELPAAKVEVVDYKEDKQDFTVQVVGSPQTKQVSQVRIAVWSDAKGQDDIKWYEPAIVNNQARASVNIANHSNTSDNYHVHVYTTYADKTTIGSDLGTFKIAKPTILEEKPVEREADQAKVEVVGYDEHKMHFKVRVDGRESRRAVTQVRIAVWSDKQGQDDIKWYEPRVLDQEAESTIHISNHANTSDKYHVHVYTTYADKETIGSNLGTYQITHPRGARATVELLEHEVGKKDFVVQVTGIPGAHRVEKVRVAVWSKEKGQDDLRWYEPKIINNQARVRVDRGNHSNTLGDYIVHVYTTYSDKVTQGTDLGNIPLTAPTPTYRERSQQFANKLFTILGDYTASDAMLAPLVSAIKHIENQGYQVGFKLSDVRTNKGIAYQANQRFYSASTIKAPFVVSLADQYPEKIAEHRPIFEAIARESSNSGYAQLAERYGQGIIHHWADQSGLKREPFNRLYPEVTPAELHALWESNYDYIQESSQGRQIGALFQNPNLSPIKSVLGQTYKTQSKAGWIGGWGYRAANDAGIVYTPKGDYILSIMSNSYGNLGLLNPLVAALNQLHQKL